MLNSNKHQQQQQTTITPLIQAGAFTPQQLTEITAIVQQSLCYGVQCVTTEKAAELLSVEPQTVRDWINSGKLPASRPGKDYLILMEDINRLLTQTAVVIRIDKRYKNRKAI